MGNPLLSDARPVCAECGHPDAQDIGGQLLCAACCHARASCGAVREIETDERPLATNLTPATNQDAK